MSTRVNFPDLSFIIINNVDSDDSLPPGVWQAPSSYRHHLGDRYGLKKFIQIVKKDADVQCNLGNKVFESAADLVIHVLRQLVGQTDLNDGISSSMDAGWR